MKIAANSLGSCSVVEGGDQICLALVDADGRDVEITVSTADACSIAMTLPRLLKTSLTEKYRDASLRYVFPLDMWQVEAASDGAKVILTFSTGAGYEVSFATNPAWGRSLALALIDSTAAGGAVSRAVPN